MGGVLMTLKDAKAAVIKYDGTFSPEEYDFLELANTCIAFVRSLPDGVDEAREVVIVEEVPGVEPHWWIKLPEGGNKPGEAYRSKPTAWFESHAEAVHWCETLGWKHTTNYFEP